VKSLTMLSAWFSPFDVASCLQNERQREPDVKPWSIVDTPLVSRLQGAHFRILGIGRIGTAAALRAKAFGYHVLFYDPYIPNGYDNLLVWRERENIKELFSRSTTLSIHCNCTTETRNMIGWDLQPNATRAVLVNTGRRSAATRCSRRG